MAKKKKFDEAGAVAEKTVWNKAKTRKWQMTYRLIEVKAARKLKSTKATNTEKPGKATKPKKASNRKNTKKKKPTTKKKVSKGNKS